MPLIAKDLGISHGAGGFVWGAAPLGIALASPAAGLAVDRFGARRVAAAALLAGAAACAARALCQGPWSLAFAMFAFGVHIAFAGSLALARNPELRRVAVIQLLLFGGYLALLGLLPRALGESGFPPARVGMAVALWLASAALANAVGPYLSDRLRRRRPVVVG